MRDILIKKQLFKRLAVFLTIAVICLVPITPVQAEGIVGQLTTSATSTRVGSTVTVTFSAVPAVTISAYQVTVNFDTNLFEYVSGADLTGLNGGNSIDNNGGSIAVFAYGDTGIANVSKLCKLTFKAKAEGSAVFSTSNAVINDESPASTSVTVSAGATESTQTSATTVSETTSVLHVTLELADGSFEVVPIPQNFPTPTGFYRTAITVTGIRMEAFKATQGDLVLIYLDNEYSGTNLYFYDSNANTAYLYAPFSLPGHEFVLIRPDASAIVPEGFSSTSLTINDLQINCWKKADVTDLNDPYYDTYLLYLLDSEGQKGFFLYKPANQFIFPYLLLTPSVDTQSETSAETDQPVSSQTEAAPSIFSTTAASGFNLWMIGTGVFALLSLMLLIFLIWTYFEYIRPLEKQSPNSSRPNFDNRSGHPVRPVRRDDGNLRPAQTRTVRPIDPPASPIREERQDSGELNPRSNPPRPKNPSEPPETSDNQSAPPTIRRID